MALLPVLWVCPGPQVPSEWGHSVSWTRSSASFPQHSLCVGFGLINGRLWGPTRFCRGWCAHIPSVVHPLRDCAVGILRAARGVEIRLRHDKSSVPLEFYSLKGPWGCCSDTVVPVAGVPLARAGVHGSEPGGLGTRGVWGEELCVRTCHVGQVPGVTGEARCR